jgi:serine/threonine protein kinase
MSILDFVSPGDPNELFSLEREIAVGSFGTVYAARDKQDKLVALKIVALEEDETFEDLAIEIDVLKKCSHRNIVGFYGSWSKGKELFIAMELCEGGSVLTVYDGKVDISISIDKLRFPT